ncbi:Thioredoxin domain-containing protein [Plasmodiophora brassicae]
MGKSQSKNDKDPPSDLGNASGGATDRLSIFAGRKTFRENKGYRQGTKRHALHSTIITKLIASNWLSGGVGDMRNTVQLPDGEDLNEWMAVNTVHFFNAASMVYGTCTDFCSDESCPVMSAGPKYEYLWADGNRVKKPIKVSAPKYIEFMFDWIDEQISNPTIFPVDDEVKFPKNFSHVVKNIFKRLFRLYGHIYYSHFEKIQDIGAEAHLNSCFKHLIYFINEFKLVDKKELAPLQKLIDKLLPDIASSI